MFRALDSHVAPEELAAIGRAFERACEEARNCERRLCCGTRTRCEANSQACGARHK